MDICDKDHVGYMPDAALKLLEDLPKSQREAWRHRCAACAYQAGFDAGLIEGERRTLELLVEQETKTEATVTPITEG